ncbi:MAG: ribose-phosphate pyrophosphokinase-like domain-containing protein, partial [Lachnospiraceae bacterium]|nr:ribose-phosphate pyrophosphokinase-like domain-containing protein [Lachnospiraceae bacterium]
MPRREEKRNLETIPVGTLGVIPLRGCHEMGEMVDKFLVGWRTERENEHKGSLAFTGYERPSYLLSAEVPRFGSGEGKGVINESVRGADLYLLVDVMNHAQTYSLFGKQNHMSPDDHYQDLKRIIAAIGGKARRITVIMP